MRLLLVILAGLFAAPALAAQPTAAEVVSLAIAEAIRPGFAQYAAETAKLEATIESRCGVSEDDLAAMREQFRAVVSAWSRIELYRIGPLLKDNRSETTLFWPDRKGIALRQVQAILSESDRGAFDAETLRSKSVAVQGLGALEFVLFGTNSERLATIESDFACHYAGAIATLLNERATAMSTEWDDPEGFSRRLLEPSAEDPEYRSFREVAEALTGLLAHGVEAIRDQRMLPFLGRDGAAPKPKSALFWRSGMTVPSLLANFDGLRTLLDSSRIAEATADENLWVGNSSRFEFGNVVRAGALLKDPIEAALADPKQRHALDYIVLVTQSLDVLLGENLAAALGLSVGFSSLDGD